MKIRAASAEDIPVLAELLHELFAIEADFTPDFATQAAGLALVLARDDARIFVAEQQGAVVGMCACHIHISTARGRAVGIVEDVVVDIDHRGRGIGAALLRGLESWAERRGLDSLRLLADRDNHPALGFYRRLGWRPTKLEGWTKPL